MESKDIMKIVTIVEIPDELAQEWFQHIRDFDIRHAGKCQFTALAHSPDKSTEEMSEMLNVKPPLQHKLKTKS